MTGQKRRRIVVDGREYRWQLGGGRPENATPAPGLTADALVVDFEYSVVVYAEPAPRSTLTVYFRGRRAFCVPSLGFADAQSFSVTPGLVAALVRHARAEHDWDTGSTKQNLCLEGGPTGAEPVQHAMPANLSFDPVEHLKGLRVVWQRPAGGGD